MPHLLLGLVAGAIAKALHRGDEPGGLLGTLVVGELGMFVAFAWLLLSPLPKLSAISYQLSAIRDARWDPAPRPKI